MNYRERGSRARGVYHTQYTSRMGTVRVKQEEERNMRTKGKSPKQGLTSAKDLPMEFPEGRESPYLR